MGLGLKMEGTLHRTLRDYVFMTAWLAAGLLSRLKGHRLRDDRVSDDRLYNYILSIWRGGRSVDAPLTAAWWTR